MSVSRPSTLVAAAAAVLCAFPLHPVRAQQATGEARGTVTAALTKEPIIGACIALGAQGCAAVTDARGEYVLRSLPVGKRQVVISAQGRKLVRMGLEITAGQVTTLDVALESGALMLNTVAVSATRTATEASKVASTLTVFSPEQVAQAPARETQDMLREIPGVELPRTSSLVGGTAQIVSLRGVDEGRTVVLMDGVPIGDAWGEWIDWGRVPKGMVDRVEVVEGGTSNLYGNGAIGGVISFFSKPMLPGASTVTIDGGSRDARHIFVGAGVPLLGAFSANVYADYLDGGGYAFIDPAKAGRVDGVSAISQNSLNMRLNYAPAGDWSGFLVGHMFGDQRNTGTPLGYAGRSQRQIDFGVNNGNVGGGQLALRGWYGSQYENQRSSSIRAAFATCTPAGTAARACEDSSIRVGIPSRDWGATAQWTRGDLWGFESFSVGADYRHMNGTFYEADFNTSCPGANCGKQTQSIQSGGNQDLMGAFVQAVAAPATDWRVELGLRYDSWSNVDGLSQDPSAGVVQYANRSSSSFSPRIGVRWQAEETFSLRAAYYQAFRAPNLAELYRKQISANGQTITLPNPGLKPEYWSGYELGFDWQPVAWAQFRGTGYIADYTDFNVPTQIAAGPPAIRQRLNINKSRSRGLQGFLSVRPVDGLFLSAGANYDDARVVSSDSTNNAAINRVPSPRWTLKASYASAEWGTPTVMWRHEGQTTTLQGLPLQPF
ncbi:MAG: TonB-dependent receptor, partial [Gemmatimonadetes bacterium]|nr:TonB-dependent receptor [Gemmatimonadota bacterium]